jgi:hypothetical protein
MNTYKIYIRRPMTLPPVWDWSDTIVSKTQAEAISDSYQKWVDSNPNPAPPALANCTVSATLIVRALSKQESFQLATAPTSDATASQQAFMDAIQSEVSKQLSTVLDGTFETVNYPSGFNYGITYGNNANYNQATLQDIDTMLGVSSNGLLELTGSRFSNYYAQLLPNIVYAFSQADQQTMQNQDTAASGQVASILAEFSNAGGVYTNPLPFGGKLQDVFNQLSKTYGSLDNIPDTLNSLRNAVTSYKAIAAESYALHAKFYSATARLQAMATNVTTPSATNGGMEVDTGEFYVGYTPNKLPTANQLIGGLSTDSNAIEVDLALSNFSSKSSNLSISGKAGFTIPILDILDIGISASASYNVSKYASSATNISMNIKYKGVTHFASMPSELSTDLKSGWYAIDILQQVVANSGKDTTGYQLTGSEFNVADIFGPGKIFSRLKTFVISQQPEIRLTISGAQASQIKTDLKVGGSVSLKLFDLFTLGSASANYSVTNIDDKSVAGSVVVTFGPPNVSGTIPIQNQVAYVLGGVASYPPNNI